MVYTLSQHGGCVVYTSAQHHTIPGNMLLFVDTNQVFNLSSFRQKQGMA